MLARFSNINIAYFRFPNSLELAQLVKNAQDLENLNNAQCDQEQKFFHNAVGALGRVSTRFERIKLVENSYLWGSSGTYLEAFVPALMEQVQTLEFVLLSARDDPEYQELRHKNDSIQSLIHVLSSGILIKRLNLDMKWESTDSISKPCLESLSLPQLERFTLHCGKLNRSTGANFIRNHMETLKTFCANVWDKNVVGMLVGGSPRCISQQICGVSWLNIIRVWLDQPPVSEGGLYWLYIGERENVTSRWRT